MAKPCSVCSHPDVQAINVALLNGATLREITGNYPGLCKSAIDRHKEHLPAQAIEASGREKAIQLMGVVDSITQRFRDIETRFDEIAGRAQSAGDIKAEVAAVRELRLTVEAALKSSGQWAPAVQNAVQVNVNLPSMRNSREWAIMVRVLDRHPEIRHELDTALLEAGL